MRVKICGITNVDDAIHAIHAGADALGFVFYERSPRYITPEAAKEIVKAIPPFIERVGLFVDHSPEEVNRICQQTGMSLAQIHFEVEDAYFEALSIKSLPVVRAQKPEDLDRFDDRYRLVDAYVNGYGGEGKRLALEWFGERDNSRIILAGGLSPKNVAETTLFGFYGVDVSSGVEASKGYKDPDKVELFITHAKGL
jgi:phosphoribosylanthranilate isomerase